MAELATVLLCDAAARIKGETMAIDGGAHLRSPGAEDLPPAFLTLRPWTS